VVRQYVKPFFATSPGGRFDDGPDCSVGLLAWLLTAGGQVDVSELRACCRRSRHRTAALHLSMPGGRSSVEQSDRARAVLAAHTAVRDVFLRSVIAEPAIIPAASMKSAIDEGRLHRRRRSLHRAHVTRICGRSASAAPPR